MSTLLSAEPTLLVRNVELSATYFKEKLGFKFDQCWGDPPDFTLVYRDSITVTLCLGTHPSSIQSNHSVEPGIWDIYFHVSQVDELFSEFSRNGAAIEFSPRRAEYGAWEFGVLDLDKHLLIFGSMNS